MSEVAPVAGDPTPSSHKLLQQVLWPALAGNVLWSFFGVANSAVNHFKDKCDSSVLCVGAEFAPRLISLLVAGLYLCADWELTERMKSRLNEPVYRRKYLSFETVLAVAITLYAFRLSERSDLITTGLMSFVYGTAALGLWIGTWPPIGHEPRKLALLNSLAFVLNTALLFQQWLRPDWPISNELASTLILCCVLGYWGHHVRKTSRGEAF